MFLLQVTSASIHGLIYFLALFDNELKTHCDYTEDNGCTPRLILSYSCSRLKKVTDISCLLAVFFGDYIFSRFRDPVHHVISLSLNFVDRIDHFESR